MAVARHLTRYAIASDRVKAAGTFSGIITGQVARFNWEMLRSAMSGAEQTLFNAIRSFLLGYLTTEEVPDGYVSHGHPNQPADVFITVDDAGDTATGASATNQAASGTTAWMPGPYVRLNVLTGGETHELIVHSSWSKALAAFTPTEQTQLQDFVTVMHAHLVAEWPLPPWPT